MEEMQFLGMLISGLVTLGGFIAIIVKFIQPINDLRIVIQKLNDKLDTQTEKMENHDRRIEKHGLELDKLDNRVGKLETKMDIYHRE